MLGYCQRKVAIIDSLSDRYRMDTMRSYPATEENMPRRNWGYRKVPVIIRVLSEDDSILSIDEDRRRNATLLEDSFYNRKNLNPQIHDTEFLC